MDIFEESIRKQLDCDESYQFSQCQVDHLLGIIDELRKKIDLMHLEQKLEKYANTELHLENEVLREQNFAMNKRLAEIGKAVKPIANRMSCFDGGVYIEGIGKDLRKLIAAVKED